MAVAENALAPNAGLIPDGANAGLAPNNVMGFVQSPAGKKILLAVGIAAVIAVMAATWMWSQKTEYRVLFSNFSDKDGGAIVASLQQMNIPYQYSEGGGAILVPAQQVYDARLKLAAQGLPKGGNVGFELMENQKLGISQFLEQVNFQRALEGELARSIQAVAAVQSARVHLALPKASVFVRDQQKPTASVLLNLNAGRSLDPQQVSAIVHLVASSVPELSAKNVTVVDQSGNLLSNTDKQNGINGLDPSQLKYVQELQQNIVKRIESIITPIVGPNNVRAEATADVDFSRVEQAAETYKPNQTPDASVIRSQQSSESSSNNGGNGASGVPGALSNQPQPNASAPINGTPGTPGAQGTANGASTAGPTSTQKDVTTNYEVDKTIRYVQQPMVGLKRLSVAVVVNHRHELDKKGNPISRPLTEAEKTQITDLVKEAMGYSKERGDSLNVVNSPFAQPEQEKLQDLPLWKQPEMIHLAKDNAKYVVAFLVMVFLYFKFLKPMLNKLTGADKKALEAAEAAQKAAEDADEDGDAVVQLSNESHRMLPGPRPYEENLSAAKQLAKEDPKVVANIMKSWMGAND